MTVLPSPFDEPASPDGAAALRSSSVIAAASDERSTPSATRTTRSVSEQDPSSRTCATTATYGSSRTGHSVRVRDLKGLHDLAVLFAGPARRSTASS